MKTNSKWIAALCAAWLAMAAFAQAPAKPRIERAADLPVFTYKVEGDLEPLVRDGAKFSAFVKPVYADIEGVLAKYDIAEKAARRQLLGVLTQVDLIEGRWDGALARSEQVRELQEKPADKLLSGLTTRAIAHAAKKTGASSGAAFDAEVGRLVSEELAKLPFEIVRNDILQFKAGTETIGESLVLGRVREVLQPVAAKQGALSSDLVPALVGTRYALVYSLPLKTVLNRALVAYVAAHNVDKPDIWGARDVALPPGRGYKPVTVVVWDSGVDAAIFADRFVRFGADPAFVAFDKYERASASPLKEIPDTLRTRLPELIARSKGLSDLQSNIDSPEASEVKKLLSTLAPQQYKATVEELRLASVYEHGTHVSGIAVAGNPYARLANMRIDFSTTLLPDPCPSMEVEQRGVANLQTYADFLRKVGARVVNMSWGGNVRSVEVELEQCGIGKDAAERKTRARELFQVRRNALEKMFASMPNVLFVTSAGNSGDDPTFNESYPSGIELPNLVAVGAVDKAGDEASFTSYGKTVLLHANGYQVVSYVPGGSKVALSGTSMASPQVANLAAKMLAVNPSLKPTELIGIMRHTADVSADGRRTLIHPARALAEAGYRP
ncbi:MAG TPA: S8 family serine peptidase [Ramlibacter sp.]|uniref:S8 family serine peptidase n=1 Tax=Ramlibacter sp. TaxID=1917967 RepID=UPI002C5D29A6|nr:S8 family serine peptidase [Ramlibacter sp.]HVZ46043.1 S8 family serine peptidase [Ramlibacter sp.]